ncbi:hypothetical protein B296_00007207 [Ensete ventricosum]|uniref:Transport inhibitor response 1 domain-containing protein n=1 Tax=Ensete ventricosum TaxID=4639 RepID=A0A426YL73_ENSVE|nr:hypothetical protein B296_00007207 [Ensete ventricosum]
MSMSCANLDVDVLLMQIFDGIFLRHLRVLDLIEAYLEEEEEDEAVDWISKFPQTTTSLETLGFDCVVSAVNFEALEALVARSPALRQLRVNHHVTVDQLFRLMVRAPQLTHLGTGSFGPPAALAPQGDVMEHEADLVSAFAASRSIVSLSGFRDIASQYLPAIYPVCANLTTLNFSFAEITADELKPVIHHCYNLQKFWVLATYNLSCPNLVSSIFFPSEILCRFGGGSCFQVLDTVRDEGLQAVAATCKDLRELRVFPLNATEDSEGFVSDVGLAAISEGCRRLRSILYFCQQMTNKAVITMSKNCQELVVFRLCIMGRHLPDHHTKEPMDEGFGAIVMNCKKLTRLAVSGLLTDKAFGYIGKYGKSIRTLSVAFAGDSDVGLRYVLEGCPKLQKLEIRDSPFGDPALLSGIHQYYNMRFLWMNSCKLSIRGCKDVAQRLPRLVVEVIRDRPEADEETVEKLYMYRSLAGPRNDAPPFVKIL